MAWTPTYKIIRSRAIADNLLAYIATNQADALAWAGGAALRLIQNFSNSVANRSIPVFPSIAFVNDSDAQGFTEDVIAGAYSLVFEVLIQNADPNTAVSEARVYAAAIVSMVRNCPSSTLLANVDALANTEILESVEVQFEEIKTNDLQNDFLQQFQVRTIYQLAAQNHR